MTKPITDRPLKTAGQKPWVYDEAIALEVCERLSEGESLRSICEDPRLPSHQTIYKWAAVQPIFKTAYARAREAQMERWSDDIVEIADEAATATGERIDKEGTVEAIVDPGVIQAAKLRIDTRKFLMAKLAPQRYGERVDLNVSGSVEVSALSDEELEARTRARLVALGVAVAGPLLLALPGAAQEPTPIPTPEPEPTDGESTPTAGEPEPTAGESTPGPRSTRKKSANDLLGLVV